MTKITGYLKSLEPPQVFLLAFYFWALFAFISNSLMALHHVFVFLSFLILLFKAPSLPKFNKSEVFLLGLTAAAVLSVLLNWTELVKPFSKVLKLKYLLAGALAACIARNQKESLIKYRQQILIFFLLSFLVTAFYGLARFAYEYLNLGRIYRVSGFFGMIMSYAYTAVWPFLLMAFLALNKSVKTNWKVLDNIKVRWALVVLFAAAIVLSQARGALVGIVLAGPFLLLGNKRRFFGALFVVGILSVGSYFKIRSATSAAPEGNRIFQGSKSLSNLWRLSQFEMSKKAFSDKPFLGQGWRSLEERTLAIKEKYNLPHKEFVGHAHNNYLEVLATCGILGFVCFLLWLLFWLKDSYWSNKSPWRYFYLAGISGFLVSGLFQSTFIDSEYAFTLFAFYGMSPLFIEP